MFQKLLLPAVAVCGTFCLALLRPAADTATYYGPGGVIDAIQAFLRALDNGDARMLDLLVGDRSPRDGHLVVPDKTTKGRFKELEKDCGNRFFEVSHEGRSVVARNKKAFLRQLREHVTCAKVKARTLTTGVRTIRADCPSQWCSYAVVEFERRYRIGGEKQESVHMQATALVRYVKRKDDNGPHFEIFHWHASRVVGGDEKKKGG
ncbi:MAG: hypothetical protein ACYST0_13910 [Planctomycetota bacterium]|jgi:hypothetical protein